jgi:hypothetical protein
VLEYAPAGATDSGSGGQLTTFVGLLVLAAVGVAGAELLMRWHASRR